jgi:hypothetical protein
MERYGLRYVRGAEVIEIRDEGKGPQVLTAQPGQHVQPCIPEHVITHHCRSACYNSCNSAYTPGFLAARPACNLQMLGPMPTPASKRSGHACM